MATNAQAATTILGVDLENGKAGAAVSSSMFEGIESTYLGEGDNNVVKMAPGKGLVYHGGCNNSFVFGGPNHGDNLYGMDPLDPLFAEPVSMLVNGDDHQTIIDAITLRSQSETKLQRDVVGLVTLDGQISSFSGPRAHAQELHCLTNSPVVLAPPVPAAGEQVTLITSADGKKKFAIMLDSVDNPVAMIEAATEVLMEAEGSLEDLLMGALVAASEQGGDNRLDLLNNPRIPSKQAFLKVVDGTQYLLDLNTTVPVDSDIQAYEALANLYTGEVGPIPTRSAITVEIEKVSFNRNSLTTGKVKFVAKVTQDTDALPMTGPKKTRWDVEALVAGPDAEFKNKKRVLIRNSTAMGRIKMGVKTGNNVDGMSLVVCVNYTDAKGRDRQSCALEQL